MFVLKLEMSKGPGVITRSLMSLPSSQVKKIIVLEDNEKYLEDLKVHFAPIPVDHLHLTSLGP